MVEEAGYATRSMAEAVVVDESRESLPDLISPEAKHLREGDWKGALKKERRLQEAEGAVPMVRNERVEVGQIESCWNPKKSILRYETQEHQTPEAIAKAVV